MRVFYPPVGIAHITRGVADLFRDRRVGAKKFRVACVMQPKSDPHFGTAILVLGAFALADVLRRELAIETSILIDVLDNAPGEEISYNGILYTRCLSHCKNLDQSKSAMYMQPVLELATWASTQTGIEVRARNYEEIQSQPTFRRGLGQILDNEDRFCPMFSPSDAVLRIRPICMDCGLTEKAATTVRLEHNGAHLVLHSACPNHGPFIVNVADTDACIDTNAPIRTVLRSYCFSRDRNAELVETIVLNGGDWSGAWMQRVYFDGLAMLGLTGMNVPFNLFTPQILDWSGAKLSKTIYLEPGAYDNLDAHWVSWPAFYQRFGMEGRAALWEEVRGWMHDPKRLFRDYTLAYFQDTLQVQLEKQALIGK